MSLPEHEQDAMCIRWRAQPENTIGGWCVTAEDEPRTPADGAIPYLECARKEIAEHLVFLHNLWLVSQ